MHFKIICYIWGVFHHALQLKKKKRTIPGITMFDIMYFKIDLSCIAIKRRGKKNFVTNLAYDKVLHSIHLHDFLVFHVDLISK